MNYQLELNPVPCLPLARIKIFSCKKKLIFIFVAQIAFVVILNHASRHI